VASLAERILLFGNVRIAPADMELHSPLSSSTHMLSMQHVSKASRLHANKHLAFSVEHLNRSFL
jgi:hypothetical protein